ncbi:MAG: hypothetical protein PHU04_03085 [Candidatus Peribacteraceae bacterium]|nr:hypothetical protein [Candidatus Peribacteraceae bacterium]
MTKQPDIAGRVRSLIQKRGIRPKPEWVFLLKESALWFLFSLSIGLGGMTAALMIFLLSEEEVDIYLRAVQNPKMLLILSIPFLWLAVLAAFSWGAASSLQRTKRGYRWHAMTLIGISIAGSALVGGVLHSTGWSDALDAFLGRGLPYYEDIRGVRERAWSHPEEGMLAGNVLRYIGPQTFLLLDLEGNVWEVNGSYVFAMPLPQGMPVRVLGVISGPGQFTAEDVRPWRAPDMRMPPF